MLLILSYKIDFSCVKGNHEHLMETYLEDAIFNQKHSPWSSDKRYGGIVTIRELPR